MIETFLVQTPLGAWPGLGTQRHYKALGSLQVEITCNLKPIPQKPHISCLKSLTDNISTDWLNL